jgi:hypothetical protein
MVNDIREQYLQRKKFLAFCLSGAIVGASDELIDLLITNRAPPSNRSERHKGSTDYRALDVVRKLTVLPKV